MLITGFLGAGKTTLVRRLLEGLKPYQITADVILNDYEDAEIDGQRLRDHAAGFQALSASCACCGGLDDLVRLAHRAQKSNNECLLIEINGTADPIPIIETFALLEDKIPLAPRWQVTVIDARRFGERDGWQGLEDIQLATATHIWLNHRDLMFEHELDQVINRIKDINPHATSVESSDMVGELVQALATQNQKVFISKDQTANNELVIPPNRRSGHPMSHAFNGLQFKLPQNVTEQAVRSWLTQLPDEVLRAKALVTLESLPKQRFLFERVEKTCLAHPIEIPFSRKVPPSALCIGAGLDQPQLQQFTNSIFNLDG